MTTCRDIVTAALEEIAVIGSNRQVKDRDGKMAMERLAALVTLSFGSVIGGRLTDCELDDAEEVRVDTRAIVGDHSAAFAITLPCKPYDGARFQLVDVGQGFAARPVTIDPNGRLIEGATASQVAITNGFNQTWFYRADLGDWKRISALTENDAMPFPSEFDDYFITRLAMRLSPRFRAGLSEETAAELGTAAARLRARYRPRKVTPCDPAVLAMSEQTYSTGLEDF